MTTGTLTIDLTALTDNWRTLSYAPQTAAVVKADGYGCGAAQVATALHNAGCTRFFVAEAGEGARLRPHIPQAEIFVFGGHMAGDTATIVDNRLIPCLNSAEQIQRHPDGHPYAIQLDSGMNRLGIEPADWAALRSGLSPQLIMSHLACADEPQHQMNARQLATFHEMTDGSAAPRSLAATGGILLGADYHFDLTRPGVGLYGGAPFDQARPVVTLDLPVIQTRDVGPGETVGYGNSWTAKRPTRLATVSGGYADGLIRAMSNGAALWHDTTPCPLVGRVSMDLITVDVTDLPHDPEQLTILGPQQTVDDLAKAAGTIGYEILTSLGSRYSRRYA